VRDLKTQQLPPPSHAAGPAPDGRKRQLRKLMGARAHLPVKSMMAKSCTTRAIPATRKIVSTAACARASRSACR
jgi:hypothetical protein